MSYLVLLLPLFGFEDHGDTAPQHLLHMPFISSWVLAIRSPLSPFCCCCRGGEGHQKTILMGAVSQQADDFTGDDGTGLTNGKGHLTLKIFLSMEKDNSLRMTLIQGTVNIRIKCPCYHLQL